MADFEKLDTVIRELEEQSSELKEFNKVYSEIGRLKTDISENFSLLKKHTEDLGVVSSRINSFIDSSKKQFDEIQNGVSKKMEESYQDNKTFQKELDASLITRLDKHKSDIQVEIRNEGSQQQRAFENTLNNNFNNIDAKLKEQFDKVDNKVKILTNLNILLVVLVIAMVVFLYLK